MTSVPPRLVIAAVGGDGGKTLLTLGLIASFSYRNLSIAPFKKGPDYIDAAWLSLAAGRPARNLDAYLMEPDGVRRGFARGIEAPSGAPPFDLAIVEGNRGLHDGMDAEGTHSTAAMARLLGAPVILVLDATKVTRTLAAIALGCKLLEPDVPLAGVVLNRLATPRHERVARAAIEKGAGLPVVGAIARRRGAGILPDRHLGLVTPDEHLKAREAIETAGEMVAAGVDLDRVLEIASSRSRQLDLPPEPNSRARARDEEISIGVIRDSAFSFYYPENLEALREAGARLITISSLEHHELPDEIDGLYVGGGFPETHADQLAGNHRLFESLRNRAEGGLPIYAECGGLMLLSRELKWRDERYPMAGVLPVDVEVRKKPQGHGYCVVEVDGECPFFDRGTRFRGHEFHYSTVVHVPTDISTAYAVERGVGCFDKRDGLVYKNVLASYAHLHALGAPAWGRGIVRMAREYSRARSRKCQHAKADL